MTSALQVQRYAGLAAGGSTRALEAQSIDFGGAKRTSQANCTSNSVESVEGAKRNPEMRNTCAKCTLGAPQRCRNAPSLTSAKAHRRSKMHLQTRSLWSSHSPRLRGCHFTPDFIKGVTFTPYRHPFSLAPFPTKGVPLTQTAPSGQEMPHCLRGVRGHCLAVVVGSQGCLGIFFVDTNYCMLG